MYSFQQCANPNRFLTRSTKKPHLESDIILKALGQIPLYFRGYLREPTSAWSHVNFSKPLLEPVINYVVIWGGIGPQHRREELWVHIAGVAELVGRSQPGQFWRVLTHNHLSFVLFFFLSWKITRACEGFQSACDSSGIVHIVSHGFPIFCRK